MSLLPGCGESSLYNNPLRFECNECMYNNNNPDFDLVGCSGFRRSVCPAFGRCVVFAILHILQVCDTLHATMKTACTCSPQVTYLHRRFAGLDRLAVTLCRLLWRPVIARFSITASLTAADTGVYLDHSAAFIHRTACSECPSSDCAAITRAEWASAVCGLRAGRHRAAVAAHVPTCCCGHWSPFLCPGLLQQTP